MSGSDNRAYSRQSVNEEPPSGVPMADSRSQKSAKSSTSARRKNYRDLNKADLEGEARENYDRPLGNYVGDRQVRGKEGDEEGYIGGTNAFRGGFSEKASPFAHGAAGDIGHAYGEPEAGDNGYYGETRAGNLSARKQAEDSKYHVPRNPVDLGYDPRDRHFLNDHIVPTYPTQNFYRRCVLTGYQTGSAIATTLGFNVIFVLALIAHVWNKLNPFHKEPRRAEVEKEWEERISGERFSSRAAYYANFFGYECEDIDVETEDGFILRLHHLTSKKHKALGHPVILQHGILSNSVTFMVNEERSLAFWLMEQGYDVYLSNIRTNFQMPHRHYPRSDPRYWAWAIKEIGIYDLPAIVDYVNKKTGRKPAYIGHSQGTGTMFLALSRGMRPDLGNKISCFIALGPSVYAGPVLRSFPFSLMRRFKSRSLWNLIFGVREFIPVISLLQGILPGWLFGHLAFPFFAFIFSFHRHNWLERQIPKYFRTVGVANSSELLYYYMSNFSYTNCIFNTTITTEPWFPRSFPPLAIFYGTLDTLVLGKPLVERIRAHEPNVRLLKVVAMENAEHMDMIWGVNMVTECFAGIREVIEETKNGYPPVGGKEKERKR